MKAILDVINDAMGGGDVACLPCERVNLDYQRASEYLDSEEHRAGEVFERTRPKDHQIPVRTVPGDVPSILRYFLDGSRRTYKVAELLIRGRYLPLIAGQVTVGVLHRETQTGRLIPVRDLCSHGNVLAFPDEVTNPDELELLTQQIAEQTGHRLKLLRYVVKTDRDPIDLGIARIMSYMADLELDAVHTLSERHLLQSDAILVKDGPLRYKNIKGRGFEITQFRNVLGLSKTFRPSFTVGTGRGKKDVGAVASDLAFGERTVVFKTIGEEKFIGMWYMRLRSREGSMDPLQGVVKIECYAVDPDDEENGLDSERVSTISAHVLQERNVTPYGADSRWATHIYPIYQTESFIKSNLLSDLCFTAMF